MDGNGDDDPLLPDEPPDFCMLVLQPETTRAAAQITAARMPRMMVLLSIIELLGETDLYPLYLRGPVHGLILEPCSGLKFNPPAGMRKRRNPGISGGRMTYNRPGPCGPENNEIAAPGPRAAPREESR